MYVRWIEIVLSLKPSNGITGTSSNHMKGLNPALRHFNQFHFDFSIRSLALHFYSSKLFWINSQSRVEISDDRGQRQALLPATDVQALTIVQETLKPLPGKMNTVVYIMLVLAVPVL